MKKAFYILFTAVFFLACLIPSVGMLINGPAPAAANEIPAAVPRLTGADGAFNTKVLSQLQTYVANGFFLRPEGITAWDRLCADGFDTSANDDVLIGPDGWLFYGGAVNDITGANQMTDRQIWCAAHGLALMQEYAESCGADFLFTVPCGKYTLYPQHAPDFVTVAEGSNRERLEAALAAQGVNYVNLYDVFSAVDEELYWKYDSHWNSRGAALAADAILAAAWTRTTLPVPSRRYGSTRETYTRCCTPRERRWRRIMPGIPGSRSAISPASTTPTTSPSRRKTLGQKEAFSCSGTPPAGASIPIWPRASATPSSPGRTTIG